MLADRLRELRKKHGYTQAQLAKELYIGQGAVSAWEKGRSTPPTDKLQDIAALYNVSVSELLGTAAADNVRTNAVKIPVLGKVQAGIPASAIEGVIDYEEIGADMAAHGEYFGLLVRGDSMAPRILDGDVVIVKSQPDVESGDIAVVAVNGDNATIKKVRKSESGIMLIPLNSAYDTIFYTNEQIRALPVEIKGKVVELRGKL